MTHLARGRLRAALGGGVPSRSLTMPATGPMKGWGFSSSVATPC